jgi:hypothetical protein
VLIIDNSRPVTIQKNSAKTTAPSEVNRDGAVAIVWLPLAGGSIFLYASANPSRKAGCLLLFPECASLSFPQRPSAQSGDLNQPLTDYAYYYNRTIWRTQLPRNIKQYHQSISTQYPRLYAFNT